MNTATLRGKDVQSVETRQLSFTISCSSTTVGEGIRIKILTRSNFVPATIKVVARERTQ